VAGRPVGRAAAPLRILSVVNFAKIPFLEIRFSLAQAAIVERSRTCTGRAYGIEELMKMPRAKNFQSAERYPRLALEDLSEAQRDAASALMATPRGEIRGPFIPLLYSATLLDRVQKLGEFLRYECSLEKRLREVAILVTAVRWQQGYEWQAHAREASGAGVSPDTIDAIAAGASCEVAPEDEREIIVFCRELHTKQRVSDAAHDAVVRRHGRDGAVELTGICGYYTLLAMILNVAEIGDPETIASERRPNANSPHAR
jgi:4-carboxymuconolactone decarboxylase